MDDQRCHLHLHGGVRKKEEQEGKTVQRNAAIFQLSLPTICAAFTLYTGYHAYSPATLRPFVLPSKAGGCFGLGSSFS
jgi:hypothetical protein